MAGFDGKSVLVTGGGSGIGRETARAFAGAGARVTIADFNAAGGGETVSLIEADGGMASFVAADVSDSAAAERMVAYAVTRFGRLDCAVNAAGILKSGTTVECSESTWRRVIDINLTGVWLSMKFEIAAMLRGGGGSVVNVASAAGLIGSANGCAYTASKHGVVGLTRAAALDYVRAGVRVNAVCPAFVRTPMIDGVVIRGAPLDLDLLGAMVPAGRVGTPREIADAILWLASDQASFVTGTAMPIDGGFTAA